MEPDHELRMHKSNHFREICANGSFVMCAGDGGVSAGHFLSCMRRIYVSIFNS